MYLTTVPLSFFNKPQKGSGQASNISVVLVWFYDRTQSESLRFDIEETVYSNIVSYGG